MRVIKGITIATNQRGETRFVSKPSATPDAPAEAARAAKPQAVKAAWVGQVTPPPGEKLPNISFTDSRLQQVDNRVMETSSVVETADFGGSGTGVPAGTGVTDVVTQNMMNNVIDDIVGVSDPTRPNVMVNRMYRDIFNNDATCGAAISLRSTIPFSEFSVTGLQDEKMLEIFQSSVESMNMGALLPQLSIEYDVIGSFLASMAWDDAQKRYKGISPHNVDFAVFEPIPVFGVDPMISINLPAEVTNVLNNPKAMERYGEFIPKDLKDATAAGAQGSGSGSKKGVTNIPLDPKHTIFIPRTGQLKDFTGMSYLRRVLPAWLYEKALMTGTLDQVYKRQRATMHITVENTEDWVADQEEMNTIAGLFLGADLDPMGAVVVTRGGVSVNEVRRGDDFWRWDASWDAIERIKLRALGISETFVTGDASFSTMEQTLSVFMEGIRDYRARITSELFYDKMFPMIAHANGITKRRYGQKNRAKELASVGNNWRGYDERGDLVARIGYDTTRGFESAFLAPNGTANINMNDYVIPKVQWHKRLMPEADLDYITMLGTMQEMGLPINLRGLAAAGGQNIDDIVNGMDEDIRLRERVGEWRKRIGEINKEAEPQGADDGMGGAGGEEEGDAEMAAQYFAAQEMRVGSTAKTHLGRYANPGQRESEFTARDSQGNRRVLTRQGRDVIANRFNRTMGQAVAEVVRQENARTRMERAAIDPVRKHYHKK